MEEIVQFPVLNTELTFLVSMIVSRMSVPHIRLIKTQAEKFSLAKTSYGPGFDIAWKYNTHIIWERNLSYLPFVSSLAVGLQHAKWS
jgi:hypothetical protein